MKIIFGGETKRVPEIKAYDELIRYSQEVFRITQEKHENQMKLYYLDDDGDIISVSCQDDLDEAMRIQLGRLKLALAYSKDEANHCLLKGSFALSDSSFLKSEGILSQSLAEKTAVTRVNSDFSAASTKNMMNSGTFNFEMFLQNQIERTVRLMEPESAEMPIRQISRTDCIQDNQAQQDNQVQPKSSSYPQGRPLNPAKIQAIEEGSEEKSLSTVSTRQINDIVLEINGRPEIEYGTKGFSPDLDQNEKGLRGNQKRTCHESLSGGGGERNDPRLDSGEAAPASKSRKQKEISLFKRKCICRRGGNNPRCVSCYLKTYFQPTYTAFCVEQPDDGIELAGAKFIAQWTFRNTGATSWPKDVQFKKVKGDEVRFALLDTVDLQIEAGGQVKISVSLQVPEKPGCYYVDFSLAYGDGVFFGDVVTLNLVSKIGEGYNLNKQMGVKLISEYEDQDPNDSDEDNFRFIKNEDESSSGSSDLELSNDSWIMVDEGEDQESASKNLEDFGNSVNMVAYEADKDEVQQECTQLSEIEVFKYTKKMNNQKYDSCYKENLEALMSLGFADFQVNLEALQRNGNVLDLAVSNLLELVE